MGTPSEDLCARISDLRNKLEEAERNHSDTEEQQLQIQQLLSENSATIQEQTKTIKEQQKALAKQDKELRQVNQLSTEINNELVQERARNAALELHLSLKNKEIKCLLKRIRVLEGEKKKLETLIEEYRKEIKKLELQLSFLLEQDKRDKLLFTKCVLEAIEKFVRPQVVPELKKILIPEILTNPSSDFVKTDVMRKRYFELILGVHTPTQFAQEFLTTFSYLKPLGEREIQILGEIERRFSAENVVLLTNRLNSLDQGLSNNLFRLASAGNSPGDVASDFMELYPEYYLPFSERAKNVLTLIRGKVHEEEFQKIEPLVKSVLAGNKETRKVFHNLVATGNWEDAVAKQFLINGGYKFKSFWARYF